MISSGQSLLASQLTIPVLMPAAFAGSDLASTIPRLSSVLPHTATGLSRSEGFSMTSTDAKNAFRSECKMALSTQNSPEKHKISP